MFAREDSMTGRGNNEGGFTMIEVAVASAISLVGLVFLASLFTLSISQNRMIKQFNATTALAQEMMEQLNAIDFGDDRMKVGGDLSAAAVVGGLQYGDDVFVDDKTGKVYAGAQIPGGETANYRRFWRIENDPELINTVIVSVRVVALQSGHNNAQTEETTLTTVRSW
jgi:prepilin-type N-terminal cleavage/methylation domain-containing protein